MKTLKDKAEDNIIIDRGFFYEDVKESVLEFEKWIMEDFEPEKTLKKFRKIFGDFNKN